MSTYNLTSNTLSFLKFDKNPSEAAVRDSILNSPITWSKTRLYPSGEGYYKSRPYCMAATYKLEDLSNTTCKLYTSINGEAPNYLLDRWLTYPPTQAKSGSTYYYLNRFKNGLFTVEFWFYPRKKVNDIYHNRPIFDIRRTQNAGALAPCDDNVYELEYAQVILSSYDEEDENKVGVFFAARANPTAASWVASNEGTVNTFGKVGTISLNKWNHLAIMRYGGGNSYVSGGNFYIGLNGTIKGYSTVRKGCGIVRFANISIGAPYASGFSGNTDGIYRHNYYATISSYKTDIYNLGVENNSGAVYIDNVRLTNNTLYPGSSYSPPEGFTGKQIVVYNEYAYYVDDNYNISKLSFAKWNDISEADKLTLLERVHYDDLPTPAQIKLIQTDPTKDVICYNYQDNTAQPNITIEKIDSSASTIVYPTKFLDYGAIQDYILNIKATGSTNDTSNIRLAITRDGETYYTYNATNIAWVPLDNRSDVRTSGILLDSLDDIPASSWKQFGLDKFAFSISLSKMNENDPCQINDITLSISLDEKWIKANKTTQVKYKYVGPTLLKVNLLEEGKYRINYNDRG